MMAKVHSAIAAARSEMLNRSEVEDEIHDKQTTRSGGCASGDVAVIPGESPSDEAVEVQERQ